MNVARVKRAVRALGAAVAVAVLTTSPALSQPALKDSAGSESYKVGMAFRSFAPKEPYDWRGAREHIFPGNVAHYVFLDSCSEVGRKTAPRLCIDAQGVDRDAIHADTVRRALQFFRVTLEPRSG